MIGIAIIVIIIPLIMAQHTHTHTHAQKGPVQKPVSRWANKRAATCTKRTHRSGDPKRGGVLLTEILLPRIARQGAVRLISTGGQVRKARIDKFELGEGLLPYPPPFQSAHL